MMQTGRFSRLGLCLCIALGLGLVGCGEGTENSPDSSALHDASVSVDAQNSADARSGDASSTSRDIVTFSINTQDFMNVGESITLLNRIIDLHEQLNVPLDVVVNDPIMQGYLADPSPTSPGRVLLNRLKTAPLVAVSYHLRPPAPYEWDIYDNNDWAGLATKSDAELYSIILNYEEHKLDLVNGTPVANIEGGFELMKKTFGYAPYMAGMQGSGPVKNALAKVLKDKGLRFSIEHSSRDIGLGEATNGLWKRPEDEEIRLFEHFDAFKAGTISAQQIVETGVGTLTPGQTGRFLNIKMHDNDFFATASAWTAIYLNGSTRRPPFKLSDYGQNAQPLSTSDKNAMWQMYAETVAYVASQSQRLETLNARGVLALEPNP